MALIKQKKVDIAIIGGGITGLSAAYFLLSQNELPIQKVVLFERESRLGGCIVSRAASHSIHELGAMSLSLSHPRVRHLLEELGLGEDVISVATTKRAIFSKKKIVVLNALSFLQLKLCGPFTLLRALIEPLVSRSYKAGESVQDFFYRRFGHTISDMILLPMLRWIWVGQHDKIDVNIALPRVKKFERIYRSVVFGFLIDFLKNGRRAPKLVSLKGGLETLVARLISTSKQMALTKSVTLSFSTEQAVSEIIETEKGVLVDGYAFDVAIVTGPLWKNSPRISQISEIDLPQALSLRTQSLVVVSLCGTGKLKNDKVFGVVFPNTTPLANLTFVHVAYPQLCDKEKWAIRFLYQLDASQSDEELIETSRRFLIDSGMIDGSIVSLRRDAINFESTICRRFVEAIPLATRESAAVRSQIVEWNQANSRLQFASALEFGPSLGGCIESSYRLTKRLIAFGHHGSFL